MDDMPQKLWAWRFHKNAADDAISGGWTEVHDKRETEYVRADLAPGWQPIETAPKDGTKFAGATNYNGLFGTWDMVVMHCAEDGRLLVSWDHDDQFTPTHWMPLPALPEVL